MVELLNYWYAPEHGFGLAVRTGWALVRTLGWLILIWHVRRARAAARPLGLILAVTTVFAVGRLVVPREGAPPLPGLVGFAVLTALCLTVVVLLYRHPTVREHLVRHPNKLVVTREGVAWQEAAPKRPPRRGLADHGAGVRVHVQPADARAVPDRRGRAGRQAGVSPGRDLLVRGRRSARATWCC